MLYRNFTSPCQRSHPQRGVCGGGGATGEQNVVARCSRRVKNVLSYYYCCIVLRSNTRPHLSLCSRHRTRTSYCYCYCYCVEAVGMDASFIIYEPIILTQIPLATSSLPTTYLYRTAHIQWTSPVIDGLVDMGVIHESHT